MQKTPTRVLAEPRDSWLCPARAEPSSAAPAAWPGRHQLEIPSIATFILSCSHQEQLACGVQPRVRPFFARVLLRALFLPAVSEQIGLDCCAALMAPRGGKPTGTKQQISDAAGHKTASHKQQPKMFGQRIVGWVGPGIPIF